LRGGIAITIIADTIGISQRYHYDFDAGTGIILPPALEELVLKVFWDWIWIFVFRHVYIIVEE